MDRQNYRGEKNMRIKKLQSLMIDKGIEACIISDSDTMHYFINKSFHCGERLVALVVYQNKTSKLILNDLFPSEEIKNVEIIRYNDCEDGLRLLSDNIDETVIGIDKLWPSGFLLRFMKLKPNAIFENAANLSDLIRSIKSLDEQEKMRQASLNNDKVMEEVRKLIKVGKSESQLRDEINKMFLKIANSKPSFSTIVAYGKNCADPHAEPSDIKLKKGMSIIVDMGCKYDGYCSDMTRTFFVEENTQQEIYDTVLKANLAAISTVKPGVMFKDIDLAARKVIEDAGYGEYFIHRTGHGIGLSVHEPYDVSFVNEMVVEEGMCFSIEPGIYIPEVTGVRIEDLVLVTKEGCEVLNHYPKDNEVIS